MRPTALQQKSVLFDHLVGEHEEVVWHFDPERPGGVEIDDEIEFGRLLDRESLGLAPRKILSNSSAVRRNKAGRLAP